MDVENKMGKENALEEDIEKLEDGISSDLKTLEGAIEGL